MDLSMHGEEAYPDFIGSGFLPTPVSTAKAMAIKTATSGQPAQ